MYDNERKWKSGKTRKVSYRIWNDNSLNNLQELYNLHKSLLEYAYVLLDYHKVKGKMEYIAEFSSDWIKEKR